MRRPAAFLCLLGLLLPSSARAQVPQSDEDTWTSPRWTGHVTFLGANTLLGGLTAGIAQRLRGGSFSDGFTRGALGGAVAYAGRRIAVARFDGAGLLGRQVGAVGVSVVRNASERRPSLERLFFPAGPLHVYWDRGDEGGVRVKVDGHTLAVLLTAIYQPELEFDFGRSVSAGAPVFWAPGRSVMFDGDLAGGMAPGGVIAMSGEPRGSADALLAHERVHVLQRDFAFYAWGDPLEGWLLRRTGVGAFIHRYLDPGVVADYMGAGLLSLFDIDDADDPSQIEANFLGRP